MGSTARVCAKLLVCLMSITALSSGQGILRGSITDASNADPLIGVNVVIQGTALGSPSDIAGRYTIVGIPERRIVVRISCVGYVAKMIEVDFTTTRQQVLDVQLAPDMLQAEEVVITAQFRGQMAAINQQVTSNTIMNVVAKDRIQELPDNNAAESIGRLPGISIQRDGGEGSKVIVRGLPAKFNPITIDGQKIPSTDQADRSVDLTMISSDMLAGIEVSKSLTPDMDGDAIGGTVNFEMKKAEPVWAAEMKIQGGYNRQEKSGDNFRGSASISNRFFDELFGVVVEGNYQRAQRGSDELTASYSLQPDNSIATGDVSLADRHENRERFGANVVMDYDLGMGSVKFSSLYSRTERDELQRRRRYRVSSAVQELNIRKRLTNIDLSTNTFTYKYDFNFMKLSASGNYSLTHQEMPFQHDMRFEEKAAFNNPNLSKMQGPDAVIADAVNNLAETALRYDYLNHQKLKDKDIAGKIDLEVPIPLTSFVSATAKVGGKFRGKERDVDNGGVTTESYLDYRTNPVLMSSRFTKTPANGYLSVADFIDKGAAVSDFMHGDYQFGSILSFDRTQAFLDEFASYSFPLANGTKRMYIDDPEQMLDDYLATEKVTAGYAMAEVKLGQVITLIPGVRYEHTSLAYQALFGSFIENDDGSITANLAKDTVGTLSYEDVLPMVQARVNIAAWADLRLAYTHSISRPDYYNLVPRENYSAENAELKRGQPYLDRLRVRNYDAALSVYGQTLGLVSIGGYYKTVRNVDYIRKSRYKYGLNTVTLFQPENVTTDTKIYGMEFEVQTNFRFLPSPLDGIVLSANYSRIKSETMIPWLHFEPDPRGPRYPVMAINDTRAISMPGQSDQIGNVTLGYEKGKFSGRLSYIYQSKTLAVVGDGPGLDGFVDDYNRWDLSVQYKLPWRIVLTANVNNLSDLPDRSYLSNQSLPTEIKYFGITADFGVRYEF